MRGVFSVGRTLARRGIRATDAKSHNAVVLPQPGPSSSLKFVDDYPLVEPGPGQVRVAVAACGVCHRDVLDRTGAFPFITRPAVLGHEIAGIVESIGDPPAETPAETAGAHREKKTRSPRKPSPSSKYADDRPLRVGDRVVSLHWSPCGRCSACLRGSTTECADAWNSMLGLTVEGGYAQYTTAGASAFVRVPRGVNLTAAEASTVMCTFGTAWHGAVSRGSLSEGETVLVTGASGGVGTAMIQLASSLGCRVIAVTSDAAKEAHLVAHGADTVVVTERGAPFHRDPTVAAARVSMAFDAVGAPTFGSSLRCLVPGGRIVLVGNVTNSAAQLPLGLAIVKGLSVIGSDSCTAAELREVFAYMKKKRLRPRIEEVLPLRDAAQAHDRLVSKKGVQGRIVLGINESLW